MPTSQPVVLLTRLKEGDFFSGWMRDDFVQVENDGRIIEPSLSEVTAQVAVRYEEAHGKRFPYRKHRSLA